MKRTYLLLIIFSFLLSLTACQPNGVRKFNIASWETKLQLADSAFQEKRWSDANRYYNEALDLIDNDYSSRTIYDSKIREIHRKASYSLMLASEDNISVRSLYNCSTLMRSGVRGTSFDTHLLPVQFGFNRADFTTNGEIAAETIAQCLNQTFRGAKYITLVGHTDETGPRDYNRTLSLKRAKTLKKFLRREGINIELDVEGKGEDEPLYIDSSENYTQSEIDALNRRVEVIIQ
ncbi:MAG: OmpA family protein [Thiotrichaceae bacterium]|nr:OmpA family protein [Thiotrichaceae bacterium]